MGIKLTRDNYYDHVDHVNDAEFRGADSGQEWFPGKCADDWSASASKEPFARRGPRDYRRSDNHIRQDIGEYLARTGSIDARGILVTVDEGEVTLSGSVGTREEKRLAETIVEGCPGVKEVFSELRVQLACRNSSG